MAAEIPPRLHVKEYPDFMEKQDRETYESKGVIGKLFRAIKDHVPHNGFLIDAVHCGAIHRFLKPKPIYITADLSEQTFCILNLRLKLKVPTIQISNQDTYYPPQVRQRLKGTR